MDERGADAAVGVADAIAAAVELYRPAACSDG